MMELLHIQGVHVYAAVVATSYLHSCPEVLTCTVENSLAHSCWPSSTELQCHHAIHVHTGSIIHVHTHYQHNQSALCVGMSQVQNGCLYLRYGSSSVTITAKWNKTPTAKEAFAFYCNNAPRVLLTHTKAEKTNIKSLILFFLLPLLFITHNPKTIRRTRIQIFNIPTECPTTINVRFLV